MMYLSYTRNSQKNEQHHEHSRFMRWCSIMCSVFRWWGGVWWSAGPYIWCGALHFSVEHLFLTSWVNVLGKWVLWHPQLTAKPLQRSNSCTIYSSHFSLLLWVKEMYFFIIYKWIANYHWKIILFAAYVM